MSLLNLFRKKNGLTVGIDLGVETIKVVVIHSDQQHLSLVSHAVLNIDDPRVKYLLRQSNVTHGDVRIGFKDPKLKIREVSIPSVPDHEVSQVLQWSIKELIKSPLEDYLFQFYKLENASTSLETREDPYIVFGTEKDFFKEHVGSMKRLKVPKPSVIEPHAQSLANCVQFNYTLGERDRVALLDVGNTSTFFMVSSTQGVHFYRTFSGACGQSLAMQLSLDLGISTKEAEQRIKGFGQVSPGKSAPAMEAPFEHFFSKLALELQYSLENYISRYSKDPITKVFVTGSASGIPGILEHVKEVMKMDPEYLDAFKKIDLTGAEQELLKQDRIFYGVAVGLAL